MKQIIKQIIKKYTFKFMIAVFFIIVNIYLYTYPSAAVGEIVDLLYNLDENKITIINLVFSILLACVGVLLTRLIWKGLEFKIETQITKKIKDKLFAKLLKSKIEDIEKIKNGEIMSYFVSDAKMISRVITKVIITGTRILTFLIIVIIRMSSDCNVKLTACALLPVFIALIVVIIIRNKISNSFKKAQESFTELSEFVQESTDSIRTTKAFVGEEKQIQTFIQKNSALKKYNLDVSRNQNILDICINIGFGLSYAITLLYGSHMVLKGQISSGDIVSFTAYLAQLEAPIYWTPWLISRFKKFKISYDRLNKMFNLKEEPIEIKQIKKYKPLQGNIEIKDLTFKYPGCLENVLEDININIKKGETLGIIGMIGSGKTTLMNLLLKLYNVADGKIIIDGKDINEIPTEKIRERICYITQDSFLFSTTIKENINLFKDEYKNEQIELSTKKAMIYDDISNMEKGIDTVIGEKGIDLSGGQKQRVVISRAFLNKSDIVIFDDTFSALDNRTEQHLLTNIKELTKDKTCIIVSNRVSDIKHCNKILVLQQGRIIETGNHNMLLKKQGAYYEFYKNQSRKSSSELLV